MPSDFNELRRSLEDNLMFEAPSERLNYQTYVSVGTGVIKYQWLKFQDKYNHSRIVYVDTDPLHNSRGRVELVLPQEFHVKLGLAMGKIEEICEMNYFEADAGYWDAHISRRMKDFAQRLYGPLFDAIDQALEEHGIVINDIHNPYSFAELVCIPIGDPLYQYHEDLRQQERARRIEKWAEDGDISQPDAEFRKKYDYNTMMKGNRLVVQLHIGHETANYFDDYFMYRMGNAFRQATDNLGFAGSTQESYASRLVDKGQFRRSTKIEYAVSNRIASMMQR